MKRALINLPRALDGARAHWKKRPGTLCNPENVLATIESDKGVPCDITGASQNIQEPFIIVRRCQGPFRAHREMVLFLYVFSDKRE